MNALGKRLFDIVFSILALVALSPLLLGIAIWIKCDSPGPVLFLQMRIGKEGCHFWIVKFRTMQHRRPDSIDQHSERVVSAGRDPRITVAGRWLRAASLDELPQLLNILKGDMSFVGPRPVLVEQSELIPPGYMKRFQVRPGLTGLAQIRGRRSLGWLQQLAHDAEYVDTHSLVLDFIILIKTLRVVVRRDGIYGSKGLNWRHYRDRLDGRPPRDEDVREAMM